MPSQGTPNGVVIAIVVVLFLAAAGIVLFLACGPGLDY
jgi:hypothetical protein